VVCRPHGTVGDPGRIAAGYLEGVAHKVAWTITKLLGEGMDPAAELDLLSWAAHRETLDGKTFRRAWRFRRECEAI
jgi:hypothetical protein